MKRGTRVVVALPNGEEAAARFVNEAGSFHYLVQLFGEHHATTTDKGYRTLPITDVRVDEVYSGGVK